MYEVLSGVECIITRGQDYSTRRETVTSKRLLFGSFVRDGHYAYQFEARGWFLVVAKHNVNVVGDSEAADSGALPESS